MNNEVVDANGTSQPAKKRQKRSPLACLNCRKLKKVCEGGEPPCGRCETSGIECVFEKPQSNVVHDAGLARLSAIEASLSFVERRLEVVVESLGQLASRLDAGPAAASKKILSHPTSFIGPQDSSIITHSQRMSTYNSAAPPTPSPKQPIAPSTVPKAQLRRYPGFSPDNSHVGNPQSPSTLARFEERLGEPLNALAEASANLHPVGTPPDPSTSGQKRGHDDMNNGSRKQTSPDQPRADIVAQGKMSDRAARAWFHLFRKEAAAYCQLLDDPEDTYENLRCRSPFLFNTVIYIAIRTFNGSSPPSAELSVAYEASQVFARRLAFELPPAHETIQAYLILACFHPEPYVTTGVAVRLALYARYDTAFDRLQDHGVFRTDATARRLTAHVRAYIYAMFLDFKHSRYSGRTLCSRGEDIDRVAGYVDRLLELPFSLPMDFRYVVNFRRVYWERRTMEDVGRIQDPTFQTHRAYVTEQEAEISGMLDAYDNLAAVHFPSALSYPRRSGIRFFHDAMLYLLTSVYKQVLFDGSRCPIDVIRMAIEHSHEALAAVLDSPIYVAGIKYSGYLLRIDLCFAAMVQLKLFASYPHLVDQARIARDTLLLADQLTKSHDSERYAAVLRSALEQIQVQTRPASPSGADKEASTASLIPYPMHPLSSLHTSATTLAAHMTQEQQQHSQAQTQQQQHHQHQHVPDVASIPWYGADTNLAFLDNVDFLMNHDWLANTASNDQLWTTWTTFP